MGQDPTQNLRHAVHDRSNRIFPFLSSLNVGSEIISTPPPPPPPNLMQRYALERLK